jgi:DNA-binding response OmpR family regulator
MAKILIAEDDHSVREFVRRALELSGHEVVAAHDGGEAAAALGSGKGHYDLLLADIKMPVMDGIALALHAAKEAPDMPILLMTGFADQKERAHGLDQLIYDVITKPFTLDEVTRYVDAALAA